MHGWGWIKHYAIILKDQMLEILHVIFEIKGVWCKEKKGFGDLKKEREKQLFYGNCKNLACMLRPLKKRQSGANHCYLTYWNGIL